MATVVARKKQAESKPSPFSNMVKQWRKLRKCSQLDLALDAGVSQRHVSFLESGRARPSREMVLGLAEALEMPLRDRNQLLQAAGFAAIFEERSLDGEDMKAVQHAIEMILAHHEPYPAIVVDRNWSLKTGNLASMKFLSLMGDPEEAWARVDPSGNRNVYRMTFHPEGMRPLITNWDDIAKPLLMRLRREVNADPANESLADLLKEITSWCDVDLVGASIDGAMPLAPVLPMEMGVGDLRLKTFSMISSIGTALDITAEEMKIESFFPADDATRDFFKQMENS